MREAAFRACSTQTQNDNWPSARPTGSSGTSGCCQALPTPSFVEHSSTSAHSPASFFSLIPLWLPSNDPSDRTRTQQQSLPRQQESSREADPANVMHAARGNVRRAKGALSLSQHRPIRRGSAAERAEPGMYGQSGAAGLGPSCPPHRMPQGGHGTHPHSSCSSLFRKACSLLPTVSWTTSRPSASSSFVSSRMALSTLFCQDETDAALYKHVNAGPEKESNWFSSCCSF